MNKRIYSATGALAGLTGLILMAAASTGFAAGSAAADSQAQGLYSADQLLDADVYAKGNSKHPIGEVDDVLLNDGMTIQSFVVETDGELGLGGKSYVVSPNQLSVQTISTDHPRKPEYRVNLDLTADQLAKEPVYSDSWWNKAQAQASAAWQQTKHSAKSAWTQVKSTTKDLAHETGNAAAELGQKIKKATGN